MKRFHAATFIFPRFLAWLAVLAVLLPAMLDGSWAAPGSAAARVLADAHVLCSGHLAPDNPSERGSTANDCPYCAAGTCTPFLAFAPAAPFLALPAASGIALKIPVLAVLGTNATVARNARDPPNLI